LKDWHSKYLNLQRSQLPQPAACCLLPDATSGASTPTRRAEKGSFEKGAVPLELQHGANMLIRSFPLAHVPGDGYGFP
jgi:hypothetical protein